MREEKTKDKNAIWNVAAFTNIAFFQRIQLTALLLCWRTRRLCGRLVCCVSLLWVCRLLFWGQNKKWGLWSFVFADFDHSLLFYTRPERMNGFSKISMFLNFGAIKCHERKIPPITIKKQNIKWGDWSFVFADVKCGGKMNSSEDHSCIYSYYYNSCTPFFTCLLYSITPTRVITYLKLFSVSDFFKSFCQNCVIE